VVDQISDTDRRFMMHEVALQLLEHVRRLEPHHTETSLKLDLRLDAGLRVFHSAGHITEGSHAPGPRPLAAFLDLQPCADCLPDAEIFEGLLRSIDDRNLNRGAKILHELTVIQQEIEERVADPEPRVAGSERRIARFDELALHFLTDMVTLDESRHRLLANPALPHHQVCSEMVETLVSRIRRELDSTIRAEESIDLLRRHTMQEFDTDGDQGPALIQLAPMGNFPTFGDAGYLDELDELDAHAATLPLTLRAMFAPNELLHEAVVTVPSWAAGVIKLLKPTMVRSSIHRAVPRKVAETAIALWSHDPNDLYHHLDHCITAAYKLVDEDGDMLGLDSKPRPYPA
jgi:hypothetical protein